MLEPGGHPGIKRVHLQRARHVLYLLARYQYCVYPYLISLGYAQISVHL